MSKAILVVFILMCLYACTTNIVVKSPSAVVESVCTQGAPK